MTNKEAIETLKRIRDEAIDEFIGDWADYEAFDVAIKALNEQVISDDLIRRNDAVKVVHEYWKNQLNNLPTTQSEYGEVITGDCEMLLIYNKELSTNIKAIPSANRPQGHWIVHCDDLFPEDSTIECSICHEEQPLEIDDNYCPNCGARMKGDI